MYIVCKNFYGESISGNIILPVDTELNVIDNLLYYHDKPICYITSQNCYDYMADNSNGDGKDRYNLIQQIKRVYGEIIAHDNNVYAELIANLNEGDELPEYVSTLPFTIEFNFSFYNKSKTELENILRGLDING